MPPTKRIRRAQFEAEVEAAGLESESEDEWAQDRAAAGGSAPQEYEEEEEESSEEEEGDHFAQFESDEGEMDVDDDLTQEAKLGKQLSAIPFSTLLKAKKKLAKASAPSSSGSDSDSDDEDKVGNGGTRFGRDGAVLKGKKAQSVRKNGSLRKADRASKHAPMEMSSKKAVGRTRTIVETAANKARDPRFDSLSGAVNPTLFRASYSFLRDAQTAELTALRATAKSVRSNPLVAEEEAEKVEAALRRMESREVERTRRERDEKALRGWNKEEMGKRTEGKKEFWLKKADKKAVLLKAKYDTLAADKKGLRKAVEKRRRKTVQQDKKLLPSNRRSAA
ncbi:hypothetical protein RQP46_003278 [Phenoliferia psychrophenolica]